METKTITDIKNLCTQIRENLESFQNSVTEREENIMYGGESEYSVKGIIGGIQNLLTDISFLVGSPEQFIKVSSCGERTEIRTQLGNINTGLKSKNIKGIVVAVENLKVKIRLYHPRADKGRLIEFEKEIDEIRKLGNSLKKDIKSVNLKLKSAQGKYDNIVESEKKYNGSLQKLEEKSQQLEEKLEDFKKKYSDLTSLAEKAKENESSISANLKATYASKEVFDKFISQIEEREKELKGQSDTTKEYEEKLKTFTTDYDEKMAKVANLIDEAIKALNYKNAEGLSAAFNLQLEDANKFLKTKVWIIGATLFVIATLGIGAWIVAGWGLGDISSYNTNQIIFSLVGRLGMFSLTVTGAIFCANQYTKQKNIIEDYSYKTTIAKSIIAFSEELRAKEPEKYAEYISTVLKEIHQDPLRRHSKNDELIGINESSLIDKLITLIQTIK